jgi:hypothetical protein
MSILFLSILPRVDELSFIAEARRRWVRSHLPLVQSRSFIDFLSYGRRILSFHICHHECWSAKSQQCYGEGGRIAIISAGVLNLNSAMGKEGALPSLVLDC